MPPNIGLPMPAGTPTAAADAVCVQSRGFDLGAHFFFGLGGIDRKKAGI